MGVAVFGLVQTGFVTFGTTAAQVSTSAKTVAIAGQIPQQTTEMTAF